MIKTTFLFITLFITVSAEVTVLNNDNFDDHVKSNEYVLVKFYAPWCGHCKRLAPTWEELATKYADDEGVSIAKVDCTAEGNTNKELCDGQDVSHYFFQQPNKILDILLKSTILSVSNL